MAKTDFFVFLALFGAYIGQSDGHIGWVTLMPFASINPTNPRTDLWNFGDNCSAFGSSWKTQFFWVGHFEFFSSKKKNALFLFKFMGYQEFFLNFDDYSDFQQKSRGDRNMNNTVAVIHGRLNFCTTAFLSILINNLILFRN